MKEVLVFAAHPDDELLGLGGTIKKLTNNGVVAHAVILAEGLSSRGETRGTTNSDELLELQTDAKAASKEVGYVGIDFCGFPDNRMDEMDLLDIIKTISRYLEIYNPDTVFTHHHGDLNIDHRLTNEAVITACRPVGLYGVKEIYTFETPSSTEWDYNYREPFKPNVYFDVSETIEAKIKGMACYRSESRQFPHPRSAEALKALSAFRGSNVGVEYAEAFELLRSVK